MPTLRRDGTYTYSDYQDFNTSFTNGHDFTLNHVEELNESMLETLNYIDPRTKLQNWCLSLMADDASVLEAVARKNENLAFLICLNHFKRVLDNSNVDYDPNLPLSVQMGMLCRDEHFRRLAEEHVMDPLFRKALHAGLIASKEPDGSSSFNTGDIEAMERHLGNMLMERTMNPPSGDQILNLQNALAHEEKNEQLLSELNRNQEQQMVFAKMMFMGQLAGVKLKNDTVDSEYTQEMSELITHGGRVVLSLPEGSLQQKQFDAIVGANTGADSGVYGRIFATHCVDNKKLNSDGSEKRPVREYKPGKKTFKTNIRKNYGMDIAVGGIGNTGMTGSTIRGDGRNGHVYMKMMPGGSGECGSLLFGVESVAPGKTSPLGQVHDSKAIKAKQSPFLSNKTAPGNAYGGRRMDFSQMDGQSFINLMNRFDRYYRDLQNDPKRVDDLKELNKMLCGQPMDPERMKTLLTRDLKLSEVEAEQLQHQLRENHVQKDARVRITPPEPAPERPNIFKRWLSSRVPEWREANERYEAHMKEENRKAIEKHNALNEQLEALPNGFDTGEVCPLSRYLVICSRIARNASNEYDRKAGLALMIQGTGYAAALNPDKNAGELADEYIEYTKLNIQRAVSHPVFTYLYRNKKDELMNAADHAEPSKEILRMSSTISDFSMSKGEFETKQNKMRELFDELNVPDLKDRSPEYQEMVSAVGRMAMKDPDKLNELDSLRVFNAVQNYADNKKTVPSSDLGKKSLSLAYEAMETALPNENRDKLMQPMQTKVHRLRETMQPEREEAPVVLQ